MSDNKQILNNVTSLSVPRRKNGVTFNGDNIDLEENTHMQNVTGAGGNIQKGASQKQFSVQVEVEKYGSEDMNQDGVSIDHPVPDFCMKEECDTDIRQVDEELAEDDNINNAGNVFYIRKVLPQSTSKTDSTTLVTQYVITPDTIRKAILAQSKENDSKVDKYLDVAIRNLHGRFGEITLSHYDEQVNRVLRFWKDWCEICPRFRDTPLLYKCYLCYKGWWRLYQFKEHLKEHNNPNIKLTTEPNNHEFYIIACTKPAPKARDVAIESNCPKCGRDGTFHRYTNEVLKYECEGCKQRTITCSKLKEHESICMDYVRLNCRRHNVNRKDGITCQICIMFFPTQELLDRHMVEYHIVRSDEPVLLETKICKLCSGRYFNPKYHDCPKKDKSFKCYYCCRKFVVSLRHIHMNFSKRTLKCVVCNKIMVECVAVEHYIEHTRNYSMLYYCGKCENKVLFSNVKYYHDHMKHHKSGLAKRRWGARILLPTKCLNGDIVKSETTLKIPDDKLANFMCGLEDSNDVTVISNTQPLASRTAEEQDVIIVNDEAVIIVNDEAVNRAPALQTAAEDSGKVANQDREMWALQAQLDAEIQKDIEIEAAISKVFSESKTYLKLMEKESEEKGLMEQDEELYEDDLIIIDKEVEVVTVISDSEGEADAPETKTVSINNSVRKESDIQIDMEELESDVKNDIHLPPEEVKEEEEIYVSSESDDSDSNEATVKDEPDVDGSIKMEIEDEKMEIEHSFSPDNVKREKMKVLTAEGYEEMLRTIANTKKEIDSDTEGEDAAVQTMGTSKRSARKLYKCKKCIYEGVWNRYMAHLISRCPGTLFNCGECETRFKNLRFYLEHLVTHGHERLCCPKCKMPQISERKLQSHVTSHVRSLFLRERSGDEDCYVFHCKTCWKTVEPEGFLKHWQMNLKGGCLKVDGEAENSESQDERTLEVTNSDNEGEASHLQPEVIKKILDLLRIRDNRKIKKCNVCRRNFRRSFECKRHLIEHLLVESMLDRSKTNNMLRCYFCPKEFILTLDWKQHMREHSLLPAYKCGLCGKCFSDSSNYTKHRKVHNLYSFICDVCGGKFGTKYWLERHLKKHEKNTVLCKYCNKTFISESQLRKHEISRHHTIPGSFPCVLCRKRFTTQRQKLDHMWLKHKHRNVSADCPLCQKPFRTFKDVATHMNAAHKVSYYNKILKIDCN